MEQKKAGQKMDFARQYQMLGIRAFGETTGLIAVPVVALALSGAWLDGRLGTAPVLLIVGLALAFFVSALLIWRHAKALGKEYQHIVEAERKDRNAMQDKTGASDTAQATRIDGPSPE